MTGYLASSLKIKNKAIHFCYMCMDVLPASCLCTMCMHYLKRPEEGDGFPETRVTDSSKLPCGFWESSKDSLEGQLVLFTAEASL